MFATFVALALVVTTGVGIAGWRARRLMADPVELSHRVARLLELQVRRRVGRQWWAVSPIVDASGRVVRLLAVGGVRVGCALPSRRRPQRVNQALWLAAVVAAVVPARRRRVRRR